MVGIVWVLIAGAQAQVFTVYDSAQLEPQVGSWYEAGMGSPTVVYRPWYSDYVMLFESRLADADANCHIGYWGVGVAHSVDGTNWTVAAGPVLQPQPGTYHECVVAHPTAVIDDNGRDLHVWFKGEQGLLSCDAGAQPWGCSTYTGVGYARLDRDLSTVLQTVPEPVLLVDNFGYPTVVNKDGTWTMVVAKVPDFYLATSSAPDSGWSMAQPDPVMEPGLTSWSRDELYNPSMVCDTTGTQPYHLYFGGRIKQKWRVIGGGWGDAISSDAVSWAVAVAAYFEFSGDELWRHWDAVQVGTETLVWFSEKDGGVNRIGFAGTTDVWDDADVESRLCPAPDWTGTPGAGTLGEKTDLLRTTFADLAADPATSACVADALNNEVQPQVDDAFGEIMKGHVEHYGESLTAIIEELQKLDTDCSYDTTALQELVAGVAISALEDAIARGNSIGGPADPDVDAANVHLADALAAFDAGDFLGAVELAVDGADDIKNVDWGGDWCPASGLTEPYHVALCELQNAESLAHEAWQDTSDSDIEQGRDKLRDAAEKLAVTNAKDTSKKIREAIEAFQSSSEDTTAIQQSATLASSLAVRQMIDDAILSGHPSQAELDAAEQDWADGEAAWLAGDFLLAAEAYQAAAESVKW